MASRRCRRSHARTRSGNISSSTAGGSATIAAFRPAFAPSERRPLSPMRFGRSYAQGARAVSVAGGFAEAAQAAFDVGGPSADARVEVNEPSPDLLDRPLGAARA